MHPDLRRVAPALALLVAACSGAPRADDHGTRQTAAAAGAGRDVGDEASSYATDFDLAETSLSEHGAWLTGVDPFQTPVVVDQGRAFGTQNGSESAAHNYNDSMAWLAGSFSPNQRVSVVVHKEPGLSGGYQEVEVLLRWSVGPLRSGLPFGDTHSYGYEINLAWDGEYVTISQFKDKPLFDSLVSGSPITALGVQDGDVFSAEIVGNVITATLTRHGLTTILGTATDDSRSPISAGTPGVGFFRGTAPGATTSSRSFGLTSFKATALP